MTLWALAVAGFLSSTLLPGGSEALLIAMLHSGEFQLWQLLVVATLGNTLGGMTNYWLGRLLPLRRDARGYVDTAERWLHRYGYWALLLSWLPVIGDPLCLVAGWLRLRHWTSCMMILLGKALRYLALAMFYKASFSWEGVL